MIEVLTTKSGEITTSKVDTMYAPNTSTILAEHTTVIDSTTSTSQSIDTNNETLIPCGGIDTTLTREENEMISSLKDKSSINERTQSSSLEKDSVVSEVTRVNISDTSTVVVSTNRNVDETEKTTESIGSGKDNQALSSCDKPTTDVALLVKSTTVDTTSSLGKSKTKTVKRNPQLPNETTVTKRLIELDKSGIIIPHSEIPGIGTQIVRSNSGSDTPLIAERKQQSRPMMEVTETIRRTSVQLSSDQTKNVMGFQGNRYKETERRIVNVPRKTLPTDSENVLDYLLSTVRKPQKVNVKRNNVKPKPGTKEITTNEIALYLRKLMIPTM